MTTSPANYLSLSPVSGRSPRVLVSVGASMIGPGLMIVLKEALFTIRNKKRKFNKHGQLRYLILRNERHASHGTVF
ncbi:MAG: hypothetical protein WB811_04000 [Methanoregula sp.]